MNHRLITNEDILMILKEIKKDIDYLKDKEIQHSIEELSLYKAAKYLKKNPEFLKNEVEERRLAAIVRRDSKGKRHYRFRLRDLNKWQENRVKKSEEEINTLYMDPHFAENFRDNFHKQQKSKKKGAA